MLIQNDCSAVASIKVRLTFDDGSTKERVIGVGDLITVDYNANGLRKHIESGKVIAVSANGSDPNKWYIIVDDSDDFNGNKAKFSPKSILDVEIIRKADTVDVVQTVIGEEAVNYLRIVRGVLQYSKDGFRWFPIHIHPRDIIEDAEGTVPVIPPHYGPGPGPKPHHHSVGDGEGTDLDDDEYNIGDQIQDSTW